jgi:CRISPR-associated protein Cas2
VRGCDWKSFRNEIVMRRCYLVCYDIGDDKRLRKVFKIMKGFGEHWQYSIFFCVLRPIDRVQLESELSDVLNHDFDQIMIFDLGDDPDKAKDSMTVLGQSLGTIHNRTVVV